MPPLPTAALEAARAALASSGGRAVAAWLDPAAGPDAWASARRAAWEQLHTGPWRSVDMHWRDAYGAGCVLGARAALLAPAGRSGHEATGRAAHAPPLPDGGGGGDGGALAALDLADRALMLGGPAFHAPAHALIAVAEARLADQTAAVLAALPSEWPAPPDPARALPPGSLADGPPAARVPAALTPPSLSEFADAYLPSPARPHGAPVLLPGLAASWPALKAWSTPAGLAAAVGPHRTVPVELGPHYLADGWGQGLVRFGAFVADSMAGRAADKLAYLAQHDLIAQCPALRRHIATPDFCALARTDDPPTVNVWFGPAGTVSPPHTDPHANIFVQVVGVKYVRLYEPGAAAVLAGGRGPDDLANTSRVDLSTTAPSPGAAGPAGLPFQDALLKPGDALFIPKGWWHFVQALEPSASVSFWWE